MSRFIKVGVTGMRDPVTGELLEAVPLYVEATPGGGPELPEFDVSAFTRDFMKKMKAQAEQKSAASCGNS